MRHDDRVKNLEQYVAQVRAVPYDPVKHNCALFAAGAITAATGKNPVADMGVTLNGPRDVVEVLARFGGVRGLAEHYLGTMRAPLQAGRGDVVIKPGMDGETLGVCMGDHALFLGPDGLQVRQLSECSGSWAV